MEVSDVKVKKRELEDNITQLLREFQEETGVVVSEIYLRLVEVAMTGGFYKSLPVVSTAIWIK